MRVFQSPVTVLTLFGRSNYAWGGFHEDWREVTRVRRLEDEAFSSDLGVRLRYLTLPEAALRPEPGEGGVFGQGVLDEGSITEELATALRTELGALLPRTWVAPLGLGGHRDHRLVQRLASQMSRQIDGELLYYEDLPYAAQLSPGQNARLVREIDARLRPWRVPISSALGRKLGALQHYPSQLDGTHIDATRRHAFALSSCFQKLFYGKRVGTGRAFERLWKPERKAEVT